MGKKQKKVTLQKEYVSTSKHVDEGSSLKNLLSQDVLAKLKAQGEQLAKAEADQKAKAAEEKAQQQRLEQKRLENDFSYLLENSDSNWSKYK